MNNSRLILALKKMAPESLEAFTQFTQCPLYNTRELLCQLLKHILSFAPNFDHEELGQENVFTKLFLKRPFDAKALHTLTGELYGLLKRFWAHQQLETNAELSATLGLQKMRLLGLEKHFEAEGRRILKQLDLSSNRNPDHYYYRYRLADEQNAWYAAQQIRRYDESLQVKMDALDVFYFGVKFGNGAEAISRNQIFNAQYRLSFLSEIEGLFDQNKDHFPPSINVYRQLLKSLKDPDNRQHYDLFSNHLSQYADTFPPEEARALFKTAQNYCIRRINLGETHFQAELFGLYQSLLDRSLIFDEKGRLDHTDFKNMVTVGLRQSAYDWVANCIEQYADRVDEGYRENVRSYCLALYQVERDEPEEAIRLLAGITFTDYLYDLSARRLLARCFFEQEDWEGLNHHLNAFDLFLRRNKNLPSQNKNSHINFVRLLKAIAKLREQAPYLDAETQKARLQKLKARLLRTDPLAYREWLQKNV